MRVFSRLNMFIFVSVYSRQSYRSVRFRPMERVTIWSRVANVLKDIPACLAKIVRGVT